MTSPVSCLQSSLCIEGGDAPGRMQADFHHGLPGATPRDGGFSLPELLIALLLTLVVAAAVVALANPAQLTSALQPEATDMHQRARVAVDALSRALAMAGAGREASPAAGPLSDYIAAIIPRRIGLQHADPPGVSRADAITILYAPRSATQTTLRAALPQPSASLELDQRPNCFRTQPVCGLNDEMTLLVFDAAGSFDLFGVTQVVGDTGRVRLLGAAQSAPYATGALVTEAEVHTYYLDPANHQLRHYDGDTTDVPVADRVTGLAFEYFGDPAPLMRPVPAPGIENCLYDASGALKPMPTLPALGGSLAALPLSMLNDGPWCGGGNNQFDADLLRVRRVRVTVRVQAASAGSVTRWLPDYVVTFDVSPRNLNLGR